MNKSHLTHLASPEWARTLRTELLPWLRETVDLGDDVLEIGPGPGLTTDLLTELAARVTAVEIDADLAANLRARLGDAVEVIHGDATVVHLPAERFTAATCFTMLHHMPSAQAQDLLFLRCRRALRPGGALVGIDSLDTPLIRQGHLDDTFTSVDPDTLPRRLSAAGFTDIAVTQPTEHQFRFHATNPEHATAQCG